MSLDNEEVILSDDELLRVTTDLDDYAPGSTAIITAEGVDVGGSVTFEVEHVSDAGADGIYGTADDTTVDLGGDGHDSWNVIDGGAGDLDGEANGTIVTSWYVNPDDSLDETFLLSADGGTESAFASFTDGVIEITEQSSGYVLPSSGADGFNGAENQTELDLTATDSPTYVETVSGAIWTNDVFGAGTGVIDPFVRIQSNSNQDGVNTSGDINNDEKAQANGYTSDLLLSEVGLFNATNSDVLSGAGATGNYYEFRLDINENSNSNGDQYISLDDVMFFVSDTPLLTLPGGTDVIELLASDVEALLEGSQPGANVELVYDLDAQGDTWAALNYDLQAGSGVGDIALYIEQGDFAAARDLLGTANDATYVYLVSAMGYQGTGTAALLTADDEYDTGGGTEQAKWQSSDGFEEWSILKNAVQPVAIKGWKFNDLDGNVTPTESDPLGLEGWQILLYEDTDLDGVWDPNVDGEVRRTTTDENGFYQFDGLVAGTPYFLVEVAPTVDLSGVTAAQLLDVDWRLDGWVALDDDPSGVLGSFTIDSGLFIGSSDPVNDYNSGTNFHNFQLFDISGKKVEDLTGDGVTGDDTPWAGVTIQIVDGDDNVVASTTTAADGSYSFTDLDYTYAGYTVREVLPDGSYQTLGAANPDAEYTITGTSGADQTGLDFSNTKLGKITGRKLEDNDGDPGTTDDQTGENGWTIQLWNADQTELLETATTATVTVDGVEIVGYYEFDALELGSYVVREVNQDGWINLTPITVTAEGTTTSGFHSSGNNFVNTQEGSISGKKIEDTDGDGTQDAGETTGIDGITIVLVDGDGNETTTTTAGGGMWSFDDLAPGTYSVYEVIDGVYYSTAPTQIDGITVSSGQDRDGYVFLNWTPGKIAGSKSYDATLGSDFGLEGWEITLANEDGSAVLDADGNVVGPVYTNGDGNFEFVNLRPGTYVVTEATPAGWTATSDTSYSVTVTSGATVEEDVNGDATDFLNKSSVLIGGEKSEDADGDGDFGDADAGLGDWTINIWYDADGDGFEGAGSDDVLITAMTDDTGDWSVTLHDVGDYYVEEVDQAGWTQSSDPDTYKVTVSYDADVGNDPDVEFNPGLEVTTSDRSASTLDFLNYRAGGITGEKYYGDTNTPLIGWKVELYDAAGALVGTDYTDENGVYSFDGLDPGTYTVREILPDNDLWTATGVTEHIVDVASGETVGINSAETDFRNTAEIDIGGSKYIDHNADGDIEDVGTYKSLSDEWVITVYKDNGNNTFEDEDAVYVSANTAGGDWTATLSALGTYFIVEELTADQIAEGWTQSYPSDPGYHTVVVGYDSDLDNDPDTYDPGLVLEDTQPNQTYDFGNWKPGEITGKKYYFGAGTEDGEVPMRLEGWLIELYDTDADGNATGDPIRTTTTDADGNFLFEDVDPGDYIVREVLPTEGETEWFAGAPGVDRAVTVTSGNTTGLSTVSTDFYNRALIEIGGTKYVDVWGDGLDATDTGHPDTPFTIRIVYDENGNDTLDATDVLGGDSLIVEVETDADSGEWSYDLQRLGTYFVLEVGEDGWEQTFPADGGYYTIEVSYSADVDGNDSTYDPGLVVTSDSRTKDTLDFANFEEFSVTGTKWNDITGNGYDADDTAWGAGVVVYIDDNNNDMLDANERSTETDADGNYSFTGLTLDDVGKVIREVVPAGSTQTGALEQVIANPGSGGTDSGNDFTNFLNFDLTGAKILDLNGNGVVDAGEAGAPVNDDGSTQIVRLGLFVDDGSGNLTPVLRDGINYEVDSTGAGTFAFTDLGPLAEGESYVVREVGYYEQPSDGGSLIRFPDGAAGNAFWVQTSDDISVTPESGGGEAAGSETNVVLNFELGRIEGKKFWDHDRDGIFEEADGEDWAEGWVVRLWKDAQQEGEAGYGVLDDLDLLIEQDTSDANGDWEFGGLMTGTYFIEEALELQPGYVQTTPDLLGDGYFKVTIDSSGQVVLTADADSPTYDRTELPNDGALWFGNDQIDGPGVRTPGFWQSALGQTFRDGVVDNDGDIHGTGKEKTGDEFAEDDVFWLKYAGQMETYPTGDDGKPILYVGDWNWNTLDDDAEPHPDGYDGDRGYTFDEATDILQGDSTGGGGKKGKNADYSKSTIVERSLIASWLNYMAGNPIDSPLEGEDVAYWIDQAIQYVNEAPSGRGKDAKNAWSKGFDDVESGSAIQNALDGWNNWGWDGGSASYVAFDGDNGQTVVSQSYYSSLDAEVA